VFDFNLTDQKNAIAYEAGIFLKQEFGFPSASVSVMMEKAMVLIRAENFLCLAEQKLGSRKKRRLTSSNVCKDIRCREKILC
jgi:hypothetical protein